MPANLSPNENAFIAMMKESEEAEADGFSLLAQRNDASRFLDALMAEGLLATEKTKGPFQPTTQKYVVIPYWVGLTYLETVARHAGEASDVSLATKIAGVLVAFSRAASEESGSINNYHTWRVFADIAASLPLNTISDELIGCIATWLHGHFAGGTVASSLSKGLIPKLLEAIEPRFHAYALAIFAQITAGILDTRKERWGQREGAENGA